MPRFLPYNNVSQLNSDNVEMWREYGLTDQQILEIANEGRDNEIEAEWHAGGETSAGVFSYLSEDRRKELVGEA